MGGWGEAGGVYIGVSGEWLFVSYMRSGKEMAKGIIWSADGMGLGF